MGFIIFILILFTVIVIINKPDSTLSNYVRGINTNASGRIGLKVGEKLSISSDTKFMESSHIVRSLNFKGIIYNVDKTKDIQYINNNLMVKKKK